MQESPLNAGGIQVDGKSHDESGKRSPAITRARAAGSPMPMKKILLLGMAFHDKNQSEHATRGQGYRDRIRCEALENLSYVVHTLDDKHDAAISSEKKHCQTNFADARRMASSMDAIWGSDPANKAYDYIILDYFFSPAGWARTRWTDKFYRETLPMLAAEGYIRPRGQVLLPNLACVTDSLNEFCDEISTYFNRSEVHIDQLKENPLYAATESVEEDLLKCPDKLNNENQIQPILNNSDCVFISLTYNNNTASVKSVRKSPIKSSSVKRMRLDEDFPRSDDVDMRSDLNAITKRQSLSIKSS